MTVIREAASLPTEQQPPVSTLISTAAFRHEGLPGPVPPVRRTTRGTARGDSVAVLAHGRPRPAVPARQPTRSRQPTR